MHLSAFPSLWSHNRTFIPALCLFSIFNPSIHQSSSHIIIGSVLANKHWCQLFHLSRKGLPMEESKQTWVHQPGTPRTIAGAPQRRYKWCGFMRIFWFQLLRTASFSSSPPFGALSCPKCWTRFLTPVLWLKIAWVFKGWVILLSNFKTVGSLLWSISQMLRTDIHPHRFQDECPVPKLPIVLYRQAEKRLRRYGFQFAHLIPGNRTDPCHHQVGGGGCLWGHR